MTKSVVRLRAFAARGLFPVAVLATAVSLQSPSQRVELLREIGFDVDCARGYVLEQEPSGEAECVRAKHPESLTDVILRRDARLFPSNAAYELIPPGAFREAMQEKAEVSTPQAQAQVAGAGGSWQPYGQGPLQNGEGWGGLAGRIDSFDYDPASGRVFATKGTGGVWMTADKGQNWVSVGDNLPSQIVGSVGWSTAGGGTLIVAGGDPSSGGNDYAGLGAYWSTDLGATWNEATGVPDGALGYKVAVDHSNPNIVYLGLSKGLFRSTDAGRTYARIDLPVGGGCDAKYDGECYLAHFVTDVAVKEPGGVIKPALDVPAGTVLAAVGYRAGQKRFTHDTTKMHSPGNGLYRSTTGAAGTFTKLNASAPSALSPYGFTPQERIGRISLGPAIGANQDHNYIYALVQDAVLFNAGYPYLDNPQGMVNPPAAPVPLTLINGIYVSPDFGATWIRMADTQELAYNPTTGSALNVLGAVQFYSVGVQGYYNIWVRPDPTTQTPGAGIPTRLMFGLEEPWASRTSTVPLNGIAQQGPADFYVIGEYWPTVFSTSTHPDQHAGIWIPDDNSDPTALATGTGVTVIIGNDGGAYAQHVAPGMEPTQIGWVAANAGFNTLLPYGIGVAKDGTVYFGLQDNGSGHIDPVTQEQFMTVGGDGFFAAVDPDNSNTAYSEYTFGTMKVTTNRGASWSGITPPGFSSTTAQFSTPFAMDPTDARHIMAIGKTVAERLNGPSGGWVTSYDLGTRSAGGATVNNIGSALDVQGAAAYVGFCGPCDVLNKQQQGFLRGLATNVGGALPSKKGAADGWHKASMIGLPNRYINDIEIDSADPRTVYVTLGGYSNRGWNPPGSYGDTNTDLGEGHVYKSTDGGEHFSDITGNLPNAHASSVLLRAGQLIVGMDIGIFISSDTEGSTWAALGTGLPNVPVADLQLRPGNDRELFIASFGRGVWRYEFPVDLDDLTPDEFTFVVRTGVATNVFVTSESKTITGIDEPTPVSLDYGQYSINGGAYTSAPGTITNGQTLRVRHVSSSQPGTETVSNVTVGTYSTTFRSVTSSVDATPDPFTFGTKTGVDPGVLVESDVITLTGFNTAATVVAGPGAEYRINVGAWVTGNGTLQVGDSLQLRHTSSTTSLGYRQTYLRVGGVTGYFTTRTR